MEQIKNVAPSPVKKNGKFNSFLNWLERAGNKLPEPLTLFVWLAGIAIAVSLIASLLNVSAVHPLTGETIEVVNLVSVSGFQRMIMNVVSNFAGFPPLGLVLTCILGVGLAEKTGLFSVLLRKTLGNVKGSKVVMIVIFTSIMANAAADTGFIVMPPLAAMLFAASGMNPLVGMMAAYAAVAGGFSANLIINSLDVLIVSFTQPAAALVDPNLVVNPACNWYFLIVSTFLATALFVILLLAFTIPSNGILRQPGTGSLLSFSSPLMKGLVPIITLMFFIPGIVYGKVAGKIKSDKDVVEMLGTSMAEMGPYIVLSFVIAQFISYFNWSNLGIIMAIKGADFLKNLGAPAPVLLVGFILISSLINLFVGSASAKWAILSPIFVPMFMLLGFHPRNTTRTSEWVL
jgi:aminobenzoyl-glutamate transport protein